MNTLGKVLLIVFIAMVTILALVHIVVNRLNRATASGVFETSNDVSAWSMTTDRCVSGQSSGFYGIKLSSREEPGLEVEAVKEEARGVTVLARLPHHDQAISFGQQDCRILNGDIHNERVSSRGTWYLAGSVEVDCQAHGANLKGHARFWNCSPSASSSGN